jgi:two-component system response regulator MprA
MKILVVDDELPTLDALAELLRWDGHDVQTAGDGAAALEVLGKTGVDLVLLDVMMPVVDGVETLKRIRARADLAGLPVVLMTAAPTSVPLDLTGYQALLVKPFSVEMLRETIALPCRPR